MLTPAPRGTTRRTLLASIGALLAATACVQQPARPLATPAPAAPEFAAWTNEAQAMLSDTLQALRTFDVFQAFRESTAVQATQRLPNELVWDPPTGAAWDEATHVTRGLGGRAEQLFKAVTTASLDPALWREQRVLADSTHTLLDLGGALGAYRARIDLLLPGDAAGAMGLLDAAWAQWDTAAARWSVSRSEAISCGGH
jgi:hypothetical protein